MSRRGFDGSEDMAAVAWLTRAGVWVPGAPHAQNMKRCFEAMKRWSKPNPTPDRHWATEVLAAHERGDYAPMAAVKLAMAALGRDQVPVRMPQRSGPRPDAAERAAGDAAGVDLVEERW